jgi:demethylmenaquinone methyltransferase/2-methoxy-6-polyprenyl-1,4-benzoquinol methylase
MTMTLDAPSDGIRRMFAAISRRYDLLNHLLSWGIDRSWRRRTVRLVPPPADGPILDVCTGTCDLALEYWKASRGRASIVGIDFCRPMLRIGRRKCRQSGARVMLVEGDARRMPFADDTFAVVCVAFGLRNVRGTDEGLAEMVRVCRPGGRVAVLDFSMPAGRLLGGLYGFYFHRILPCMGQMLAKNRERAYNYLPESVREFPREEVLAGRMRAAGLRRVEYHPFTFGIATLYVGEK